MHDRYPRTVTDVMCSAAVATPPLTAAIARDLTAGRPDLSERERRDRLSALTTLVRVTGLPADLVILTPAALRASFLARSAAACGLSKKAKANVTSLLRAILADAGVIEGETTPIAESWAAPLARLPEHGCHGLMRLARFCSARQIAPDDVVEATFATFRQHVEETVLVGNPRELLKTARRAWNRACLSGTGWPGQALTRRARQHDYVLPLTAFPSSLQADLAAFGEHLAGTALEDPFADLDGNMEGRAATKRRPPLKPGTIALRQDHCRWAASAVVASGVPIAEITSLASLVTPVERAGKALRFLHARAGAKASAAGMHVAEALMMIAKYVAHLPPGDINRLRTWSGKVQLIYGGMTETNQRLMTEALDPSRDEKLLALPDAFFEAAYARLASDPRRAASDAMRALGIAILSRAPLRLANICGLRLDRHVYRPDPKRTRITAIHIPAEEAKTPEPIHMSVSAELSKMFNTWIEVFRPIIARPGCVFVFPGYVDRDPPITPQAFRDAIKDATHRHAGVRLSPHKFRHLAAHRYLAEYPGDYEPVRQFLSHATIETTRRFYAGTDQAAAVQLLDEVISGARRGGRRKRRTTALSPRIGGHPGRGGKWKGR